MNYKEIMDLTQWLERSSFTAYSLTVNGVSLNVSKQQGIQQPQTSVANTPMPIAASAPPPPPMVAEKANEGHIVRSPIVGTYYESSNPESAAFVKVGDKVKKGDVLCILEAMKVMNEITCDVDGVVMEILASNGDMVEARMPLFRIEV